MMSDTMTATTDQWMQFYHQPLTDCMSPLASPIEGFSDATLVITSPSMSSEGILSPRNSYTTSGQLTPKSNAFKPIRRRSRASKRTPTTLLNANTTNFRELVQQFTGCPTTSMSSFSVHKGPITLNFQQGRSREQIHHHNRETRTMLPYGTTSYNQVHHVDLPIPWQKETEQLPKQQLLQEQQSGYSLDYVKSSNFLPTSDNSNPSMEFSNGLLMNNDFNLNAFSYDTKINDGFFM